MIAPKYRVTTRASSKGAITFYAIAKGIPGVVRLTRTGPKPRKSEIADATQTAYSLLHKLNMGEALPLRRSQPSAAEVIMSWRLNARDRLREKTYCEIRKVGESFAAYLEGQGKLAQPFSALDDRDVGGWIEWRTAQGPTKERKEMNPNTVRAEALRLSGLWDFAVAKGWASLSIVRVAIRGRTLILPKPCAPQRTFADTPDVMAALAGAGLEDDPRKLASFYLLAATAIRQGELRLLAPGDVDLGNFVVTIRRQGPETTKGHDRRIPIGEGCARILRPLVGPAKYLIGADEGARPLTSQLNLWLTPYGLTPHSLRRWYNTQLEMAGAPSYVIDDLLGHTSAVRTAYSQGCPIEILRPWADRVDSILSRAFPPVPPIAQSPSSHPGTQPQEPATSEQP